MSPSCASLTLVLPVLALKSSEKKNATTVRTIGETQVPLACMLFKELATTTGTSTKTAKKSNRFRLAKQQLCMCITLFWYISLPSWHDYDVKLLNFTFCGGRKHKTTTLFFFSQTLIQSFSIQFQKNPPAFEEFKEVEYARLRVWSISNTVFNWRLRIAVAVVAWALYYVKSFTTFDWSVILSSRSRYGTCENEYSRASTRFNPLRVSGVSHLTCPLLMTVPNQTVPTSL